MANASKITGAVTEPGTEYENLTEVSEGETCKDNETVDDDLNSEDRELQHEILKNFMANSKVNQQVSGKFTNMRMTLPEEAIKSNYMSQAVTPVETEQSQSEFSRSHSKTNLFDSETQNTPNMKFNS